MAQLTPLQRAGHALVVAYICTYLMALVYYDTAFGRFVHVATLYTLGVAFFAVAAWLVYHSLRAVITGKFF